MPRRAPTGAAKEASADAQRLTWAVLWVYFAVVSRGRPGAGTLAVVTALAAAYALARWLTPQRGTRRWLGVAVLWMLARSEPVPALLPAWWAALASVAIFWRWPRRLR